MRIGSATEGYVRSFRGIDADRSIRLKPLARMVPLAAALASFAVSPLSAHAAGILPNGGHFVAGAGSISGNGTSLTIDQTSGRGVIDWSQFSIGSGNRVVFDNGSGATLNRVTGSDPSAIYGTLSATGSVYLINPQGILVGPGGVVSTGGRFVASTLDTCNCGFMKGHPLTFAGNSSASIINLGTIGSTGGDVMLIAGNSIVNAGRIAAPNGTAELAVGQSVLLHDSSTGRQVFVQTGSGGTIENAGPIDGAQVSLQAADGNIFALAGQHTTIRATGTAERDGHVWLVADSGIVALGGTIEATNANGSGGTVDTNGALLALGGDGVDPLIKAGKWNVTSPDLTIDDAAAATFARSLSAGTSIDAEATGVPQGGIGDIDVLSSIHWTGAASLTLGAYQSLTIEAGAKLKNCGTGNLTLDADTARLDNGGSIVNNGTIDWSNSTGIVTALYDMNGIYTPGTLLANASWKAAPYSGLVTQITGYQLVNSLADLTNVSSDLAGNYALGKDIDASSTTDGSFVPIGNYNTPFTGQFDGRGYRISSLDLVQMVAGGPYESGPGVQLAAQGLFGVIGSQGVVRYVGVSGSSVGEGGYFSIGLLAGVNDGTIVGANSSGNIDQSGNLGGYLTTSGGLVGTNAGTILRSSSSAGIDSAGNLGGLVGENDGKIAQSFATGNLTAEPYAGGAGGLVGGNSGLITESYATGNTTLAFSFCPGPGCTSGSAALVWYNLGTITQSFATGQVTDPNGIPVAGIASINGGTIGSNVYWNKDTTGATSGVYSGTAVLAANGLTNAQMKQSASFSGYDFGPNGVWAMPVGATHPVLAWQVQH
ncbi:two-partner secretion domain-containing protein [Trinickia acidisoli]|uniref:two-partner secretion domain-containing protein n=1 Tax=Trinickia acidisoli TaxID=2767482 RepID=UPI001F5CC1B6|nr:filamentous hemagglutinin N-terminal domain-containing protein [Trinickia acidisoli]